jgi:general secretion pathway protein M
VTASRQRLLALGILGIVLAAAWFAAIGPVLDAFAEQSARIDDLRAQLAAYEGHIALQPAVEMRIAALKRSEASSTGLIDGKSAELAAANIQNLVRPLIETQAGQIRSAQNLPPADADGFQKIEIQYDVSLPMTRLKAVVYRIETSTPYLFLDAIDMRVPENWQAPGSGIDAPNIDVRWTVRGYRWTGGS